MGEGRIYVQGTGAPVSEELLNTQKAAQLITRLGSERVSERRVRDWARTGDRHLHGCETKRFGRLHLFERSAILDAWERYARGMLERIEEERRAG